MSFQLGRVVWTRYINDCVAENAFSQNLSLRVSNVTQIVIGANYQPRTKRKMTSVLISNLRLFSVYKKGNL